MAGDWVHCKCDQCGQAVWTIPDHVVLILDGDQSRYTFECPDCGLRTKHADPYVAMRLSGVEGVHIVDPVDILAAAMNDDQAIADEMDGWAEP